MLIAIGQKESDALKGASLQLAVNVGCLLDRVDARDQGRDIDRSVN